MRQTIAVALLCLLTASPALATVTVPDLSTPFDCAGATEYTFTFPVLKTTDIVVTKWEDATPTTIKTLVNGTQYTVTLSSTGGHIDLTGVTVAGVTGACATGWNMKLARSVAYTQTTSFRTQGTFVPKLHEDALDKLTMEVLQLQAGITQSTETATAIADHIASSDDHTGYFKIAGRAGGQLAYGGTASGNNLGFVSNTSGDGYISLGSVCVFDEPTLTVSCNTVSVTGNTAIGGTLSITGHTYVHALYGGTSTGSLTLGSNESGTATKIYLGASSAFDELNTRLGIGTTSPSVALDIVGAGAVSGDLTVAGHLYEHQIYGGTGVGDDLDISSNSQAGAGNKGTITLGIMTMLEASSAYRVGIRTTTPHTTLQVAGTFSGLREVLTKSADYTVVAPEDCNSVIFVDTNAVSVTLPNNNGTQATRTDGCLITVVDIGTTEATGVTIKPAVDDTIVGTCIGKPSSVTDVVFFGASVPSNIHIHAAAYGNVAGDYVALVGDGVSKWFIVGCMGTWHEVAK